MADALADLLDETPTRFELEQLAAASPSLTANTPGIPVFPGGIAPAANSYTLAGCRRARAGALEPALPVREQAFT